MATLIWTTKKKTRPDRARMGVMRRIYLFDIGLLVLAGTIAAVLAREPVRPDKLSNDDTDGERFSCPDMLELTKDGNPTLDDTSFLKPCSQ